MPINLENFIVFGLVMIRMTGMLVMHPILGRNNIPSMLNAGFALVLTILITMSMPFAQMPNVGYLEFILMGLREFAIGYFAGLITLMFLSVLSVGGEILDMQIGIGMAKIMDPGTNAAISISSIMLNSMYILIFFITNNHLTLISLTAQSFHIMPLGEFAINWNAFHYLPQFMATIFIFAIKLALPIVVIEVLVTLVVGVIMRVVPQINIFVLNIQFKLLIGFFALFTIVPSFMAYLENLILLSTEQIMYVWSNLAI